MMTPKSSLTKNGLPAGTALHLRPKFHKKFDPWLGRDPVLLQSEVQWQGRSNHGADTHCKCTLLRIRNDKQIYESGTNDTNDNHRGMAHGVPESKERTHGIPKSQSNVA